MQVDYAPRAQIADWLRKGWRLVKDHHYNPGDYAIMMVLEDEPEPITAQRVRLISMRFQPRPRGSNMSEAGTSRMVARSRKALAELSA